VNALLMSNDGKALKTVLRAAGSSHGQLQDSAVDHRFPRRAIASEKVVASKEKRQI
jgi:hypothetical protein